MTQVSRRPVSQKLSERMFELLAKSITKLRDQKTVSVFLEDFFTPTEKIMMAKRIAMALLLSRGWQHDAISHYLKVSTSTVAILKNRLKTTGQGYAHIIKEIESDQEWEQIWLDLQQGFEEILASRVGTDWKTSKPAVFHKYRKKRAKYRVL